MDVDQSYQAALRRAHESMADMVLVTGLVLGDPRRAARLRRTIEVQLRQLTITLRESLKVLES
jgi:hypothetical protein